MLVTERGACTGGISPGCLEADVVEQASRVITTNIPALLEYETSTTGTELPWGLGLGCGGTIRILVEPLLPGSPIVDALRLAVDERRNAHGLRLTTTYGSNSVSHEATLLSANNSSPAVPGDTTTGAHAPLLVEQMPGVLVVTLLPRVPLVVFGAGPDVVTLVELARTLGWQVEVVDPHARPSSRHRFAAAHRVTLARPADVGLAGLFPHARAVLLVLTALTLCALAWSLSTLRASRQQRRLGPRAP